MSSSRGRGHYVISLGGLPVVHHRFTSSTSLLAIRWPDCQDFASDLLKTANHPFVSEILLRKAFYCSLKGCCFFCHPQSGFLVCYFSTTSWDDVRARLIVCLMDVLFPVCPANVCPQSCFNGVFMICVVAPSGNNKTGAKCQSWAMLYLFR